MCLIYFLHKYDFKEDGILKDNHNSIDLTELEMLDDNDEEPRQPHHDIVHVWSNIINHLKKCNTFWMLFK